MIWGNQRERGFGMLEVGLALVVVAFAAAGLSKMLTSNVAAVKAKSNAERLSMVTLAADQYLTQNEAQLKSVLAAGGAPIAIPVGKTCASCAIPTGPSGLPSVQGDGLLSTAYVDLNNNQQSHALIVKELASGDLDAIVTTYGGSAIDDENLGYITGLIGAAAGGVYTNAAIAPTTQISGAHGGWGDATSNWNASIGGTSVRPTSGHVQVAMSLAQASGMGAIDPDDVLFRTYNGDQSRNTMDYNIYMDDNAIFDARTVDSLYFRDRDNGWVIDPSASTQLMHLLMQGNTNMGNTSNPSIRFRPNTAAGNAHIWVQSDGSPDAVSIRGNGAVYADRYMQVGNVAGNRVRMYDTGNLHVEGVAYSRYFADWDNFNYFVNPDGGSRIQRLNVDDYIVAGGPVRAARYYDSTPGETLYYLNIGDRSYMNELVVGTFYDWGNDTVIDNRGNINSDGAHTARAYYYTSDERLKENIEDLDGWSVLKDLAPKSYRYKKDGQEAMGLIAQEVEKILPQLVREDQDGMKSINYLDLIGPLIDEVQNLHAENISQQEAIEQLRAEIAQQ